MIRKWVKNNELVVLIIALTLISGVTYLPLMGQIGYMNDDWYLMYSAKAYGVGAFIDIFSVDRPARALIMIPAYAIFGENPVYYNLSAYLFRLISGLAFFWLLRMLFPRHKNVAFLSSMLFLIYPGFLSQVNGLDYQSHIVALAAAHLSIALTVKAILEDRLVVKSSFHLLSVIFGLLYLSQMEWYVGFELFRWGCVFLLSSRRARSLIQKLWFSLRQGFPSLAAPVLFLIWRVFIFQSERGATNVDVQFEQLRLYPLQTLYHWAVQVTQDLYDVILGAWVVPLSQLYKYIQWWGILLAIITSALLIYFLLNNKWREEHTPLTSIYFREALILVTFIAVGGLIPIAMVNRDVLFPAFSRYTLVSSAGVGLLLGMILSTLKQHFLRSSLVALVVLVSMLTHHANAVKAVQQTEATKEFWWQISWRVPQFAKNATLIVNYPGAVLEEDYFIWGPANLIYFPEKQNPENIQPGVYAVLLNNDTVEKVHARERQVYDKRKTITTYANYRNILIMTQPGANSCVHVINGLRPEYSNGELEFVREVGQYSEIEHVLMDETPHTPPTVVFGPEPDRGWCYYYQKADLARQRGEWESVQRIGEQAFSHGFEPLDPIEWIPFLQAYALRGDMNRLEELSSIIKTNTYTAQQVCDILGSMPEITTDTVDAINSLFCPE